jgi:biopolymer transport protein ExbB
MNFSVFQCWRNLLVFGFILIALIAINGSISTSTSLAFQPAVTSSLAQTSSTQAEPDDETRPVPSQPKRGINFLSLLTQGGWFMIPLLMISIGVVTIAIERSLALRREKIFPHELIDELALLSQEPGGLDPRRAYEACQRLPSSAAYVLRSMLVKVGRPQLEIENAVSEATQREATRLTQMTSWLSLAAAVAPLIGLLGTVWGITQAFYDTTQLAELNAGQNRGVALANGIYVALVTTMVGLIIAIPAAILAHFFENRIVQRMNQIEEMVFNLSPQFERYEGQVRFTQGLSDDSPEVADDRSSRPDRGTRYAGDPVDELARSGSTAGREPGPTG